MSDISVSGITKQFILKERTITAVDNISLSIQDGDFITVVGPSGCGKSTLLKHIIGLLEPKSGDILIGGRSIVRANEEERRSIMQTFGVAYQARASLPLQQPSASMAP